MNGGRQKWTWADMLKDDEINLCMFHVFGQFLQQDCIMQSVKQSVLFIIGYRMLFTLHLFLG